MASWRRLPIEVDIVLVGDEIGMAEVAHEMGFFHTKALTCSEHGTSLTDDVWRQSELSAAT